MTKAPHFLRREPAGHAVLETGIRDIMAKLHANADHEVSEILAGAINLYSSAIIRFRGNSAYLPTDVKSLFSIWTTLLDVKKAPPLDFTSGRDEVEPLQREASDDES